MKANELMIGDWVIMDFNYPPTCKSPRQVCLDDMIRIWQGQECEPIPLTAEILEKNGFDPENFLTAEWEKKVYFREFPGCVVEPDDTGYTFGTIRYWNKQATDGSPEDWGTMYESRIKGLHHVHELQRALRCCGLNELADGFKV